MQPQNLGTHQATYDGVFQHPVSRNLQWREVRAMLEHLSSSTTEEHSGNVKFVRNGETLIVHPPRRKDFSDVAEVMRIRHFLEKSADHVEPHAVASDEKHLLVVIDHREARIFRAELHGSTPLRITSLDPAGASRYLHNVGEDADGQRKPESKSFYDAIVRALDGASKILILGNSTGASSAMDHLVADMKKNHPAIAGKIVGAVVIDEKHMSEDQMLAKAREFFSPGAQAELSR